MTTLPLPFGINPTIKSTYSLLCDLNRVPMTFKPIGLPQTTWVLKEKQQCIRINTASLHHHRYNDQVYIKSIVVLEPGTYDIQI